jgi:saccharopine dehydrogenase-like NADP-dependent oxidoreductase
MKIVLLGAGHIGQTIASLLGHSGDYHVTVVDKNADALARVSGPGITTRVVDTEDRAALAAVMRGHDAVVNALPYHLAITAAHLALETGCHYFDLTEDVAATKEIMRIAEGARTAFMPQCGLAPGFIGIVAHHLTQGFDSLHDVKMRVGALPAFPTNKLKYNLTWSVDGLINEYCHPCEAIHDGDLIDGAATRGAGALLAGRHRIRGLQHLRRPGHAVRDAARPRAQPRLQDRALPRPPRPDDVSAGRPGAQGRSGDAQGHHAPLDARHHAGRGAGVRHRLGHENGSLLQEVFARKIFAERSEKHPLSAIQITTAAGICAAVDLFREGKLPQRGFIRQEQVELPAFLANRFGKAYQQSRQVESIG